MATSGDRHQPGISNCSQQAIALPAIPALAHGDQHRDLLIAGANELAANTPRQ